MMMRAITALALALAMLAAPLASTLAQDRQVMPVDEAVTDPTWVQFKKRLQSAIEKRDKQYVLAILDRDVRNQGQDAAGVAEFRKQWAIDASDSPLWRELGSAMQLGAAYIKREQGPPELCAPYLLAQWPEDVEPFDHGAIVARETTVQAEPSISSPALGTLSYHIVSVVDWEVADKASGPSQKWVRIHYRDREGYVPEEHVRSPVEHTACFVKSAGGWRMVAFAPAGG
jgi:hypothetical protein